MRIIVFAFFFSFLFINCKKDRIDTFIEVIVNDNISTETSKSFAIYDLNEWNTNGKNGATLACPFTKDGDIITYNVKEFLNKEDPTTFTIRATLGYSVTNGYVQKNKTINAVVKEGETIKKIINF